MAELTPEQQTFIVCCLARFKSPSETVKAVKEEFDIVVTRQAVRHYNPDQSKEVADEWKKLFKAERDKFIKGRNAQAGYHATFRLQELMELYRTAKDMGNTMGAAKLLDQMRDEAESLDGTGGSSKGGKGGTQVPVPGGQAVQITVTPVEADYRKAAAPLAPKDE